MDIEAETLDDALVTIQGLRQCIASENGIRVAAERSRDEARREVDDLRDLYRRMIKDYSTALERLAFLEARDAYGD